MPKRKGTDSRSARAHGRSWVGCRLSSLTSKPARMFVLLCIFLGLLLWQRQNILDTAAKLVQLFGWGLVLIEIGFAAIAIWIALGRFRSFIFHGHRWLGGFVLGLAAWGVLGFYQLGGTFGLKIISYPGSALVGALRVANLALIGIFLIAPRQSLGVAASIVRFVKEKLTARKRQRA